MVLANSTCFAFRLPSGLRDSWSERISRLLSGVRSSCDMFARNSDLYFEVSASCEAFSSSAWRASSTSRFLRSTSSFWCASRRAFSCSSSLVCCSSTARDCDCLSRFSVRVLASIVLITMPIDSVSWSRNAWCDGLKCSSDASSITPRTWPSKITGSTSTSAAACSDRPVAMLNDAAGTPVSMSLRFSIAHWPTRPSPRSTSLPCAPWPPEAKLATSFRLVLLLGRQHVELGLLRADHRRQLGQDHLADRLEVALALQHAAELGEVGLQPVLLGVLLRGVLEVADHLVDGVLERRHLALRLDRDRARQVALRHRHRHLRDRAHLSRQVRRELVHVLGQVLPGARRARHLRLAAELAFHAHLARHRRHLLGEGRQRVGHVVDGVGERRDLAARLHRQLLLEVAVRHRGHHLRDAAHLRGEVAGHGVHVVGEVLPHAGHARHVGLAAEAAFGADLARHPRHLRGEGRAAGPPSC